MSSLAQKSIWLVRLWPSVLLGASLLFPLQLLGAEQTVVQAISSVPQAASSVSPAEQASPQAESSVPETEQVDRFDALKAPRDYLSGKITRFANSLDQFFGGDRHYQESNQSVLQLNLTRASGYGGDGNYKLAARLNLKLPVTEGRLRLLVETDPENNVTDEQTKTSVSSTNKISAPGGAAVAVRYEQKEGEQWYYNTDAGIKFRGITTAPNPFVRARGSYSTALGEWRSIATESLFWFNTLGLGETTQLDLERIISAPLLFRASSNATWLHDKQNFDLRQDLTFFHTLNNRTALRYQASVIGVSNPKLQVTDYVVQMIYRYRLNREWLFFEVSPQLHFPAEKNYKSSPALSMRLEVLFDDTR